MMQRRFAIESLWQDYGLSITLILLFIVSWGLQTWMGWVEFQSQQGQHGEPAVAFGDGGYFWEWGNRRSKTGSQSFCRSSYSSS